MQRYFVDEKNWLDQSVVVTGDDVHHIVRVMRQNIGDSVICVHPDGRTAVCAIEHIEKAALTLSIQEWSILNHELPIEVTLVQGLPKGTKLELILQKSTELGVTAIQLFQADRSITKWDTKKASQKLKRYEKILKEASEQSYRNIIPQIMEPAPMDILLEKYATFDYVLFAYEEEAKRSAHHSLGAILRKIKHGSKIAIFIGPEGGFSEREVKLFNAVNFQSVRLGKRILRTETASLYALSAMSYHFEEMIDA